MLGAILFGHEEIKKIVSFIDGIVAEVGKPRWRSSWRPSPRTSTRRCARTRTRRWTTSSRASTVPREISARTRSTRTCWRTLRTSSTTSPKDEIHSRQPLLSQEEKVRAKILDGGVRPDGRSLTDIRPIWCEVGLLPRAHGSAVFTRGQTQAMTVATLGTISEVQKLEGLDDEYYKRYMHQYNMPGYSTARRSLSAAPADARCVTAHSPSALSNPCFRARKSSRTRSARSARS